MLQQGDIFSLQEHVALTFPYTPFLCSYIAVTRDNCGYLRPNFDTVRF